jgi:hypothetical protein
MDGENPEEFKALVADLMSEFEPATPTEQILVERMGQNQWLTLRAFRLQNEAFAMSLQYRKPVNANLALFIRYQATADRNFHKAHTELVKAQKERQKSEIDFESQNAGQAADPPPAKLPCRIRDLYCGKSLRKASPSRTQSSKTLPEALFDLEPSTSAARRASSVAAGQLTAERATLQGHAA